MICPRWGEKIDLISKTTGTKSGCRNARMDGANIVGSPLSSNCDPAGCYFEEWLCLFEEPCDLALVHLDHAMPKIASCLGLSCLDLPFVPPHHVVSQPHLIVYQKKNPVKTGFYISSSLLMPSDSSSSDESLSKASPSLRAQSSHNSS